MGTGRQASSTTAKVPVDLDEDALQLERQVCFALVVASRSVLAIYRPLLEPLGLTHPQYLVMLALWGKTPLSVGRIGSLLQLDSPTLSPLLKRLQAAGLITRTRGGDDERQVHIDLTDDGWALREKALAIPPAVVEKLGMEIPDLMDLHAALTQVIAAANDEKKTADARAE
jgi:MarR family transcriptional regulator, organic hydroperoxide resistance regulator